VACRSIPLLEIDASIANDGVNMAVITIKS
jgi:hypothetical protein